MGFFETLSIATSYRLQISVREFGVDMRCFNTMFLDGVRNFTGSINIIYVQTLACIFNSLVERTAFSFRHLS